MRIAGYVKGALDLVIGLLRMCVSFIKRPHYVLAFIGVVVGIFYFCGIPPKEIPAWWTEKASPALSQRAGEFSAVLKRKAEPITDSIETVIEQTAENIPAIGLAYKAAQQKKEAVKPAMPAFQTAEIAQEPELPEPVSFAWGKKIQENELFAEATPIETVNVAVVKPLQPPVVPPAAVPVSQFGRDFRPVYSNDTETEEESVEEETSYQISRADRIDQILDNISRSEAEPEEEAAESLPQFNQSNFIEGIASVTGGDTLKIKGYAVRLRGIKIRSGKNAQAYKALYRLFNNSLLKCSLYESPDGTEADCFQDRYNIARELIDLELAD